MEQIKKIPTESIDCSVFSPPYWGLRDYGESDQWGLEADFRDYLDKMMQLMEELRRVIKPTGTVWVNLGDTYAGGRAHSDWSGADDRFKSKAMREGQFEGIKKNHVASKSQYGIPQRFYAMCIDDGWVARNWVTWLKNNAMPFSGNDRLKNMTEPVMFFAKKQDYYFNLNPVRKRNHPVFRDRPPPHIIDREGQTTIDGLPSPLKESENKQDNVIGADGKRKENYAGFNTRWKNRKFVKEDATVTSIQSMNRKSSGGYDMNTGEYLGHEKGANPGDVLKINTRKSKDAHFATFPVDLPKTILQMACPPDGTVLDPFFGSGTTGVAAEQLGLQWVGIELNEEYVEIARKRLKPYLNQKMDQPSQ